ncbi:2353_t:CDS:2, partial [Entrophospora sp. SA101]
MKENTINFKENINNNKSNKLNLPTTWTKKKMASLFLMGWLSVNGVEAGNAFKNCLAHKENDTTTYNSLLGFNFAIHPNITNDNGVLTLCCGGTQCSASSSTCSFASQKFYCTKIDKDVFCGRDSLVYCRGFIGDNLIATNAMLGGECADVSLSAITNHLATVPVSEFEGLEQGYVRYSCSNAACANLEASDKNPSTFTYIPTTSSSSILTIPTSTSTISLSPYPSNSSSSSSILTTTSASTTTPPSDLQLTEKVAIPIGTVVGVVTISGITYYLIRRRRKNNNSSTQEQNNSSIEL